MLLENYNMPINVQPHYHRRGSRGFVYIPPIRLACTWAASLTILKLHTWGISQGRWGFVPAICPQ